MSDEERDEVGEYAGETVDDGFEAEAFSRYIGLYLGEVNDGKTYSENQLGGEGRGARSGNGQRPEN